MQWLDHGGKCGAKLRLRWVQEHWLHGCFSKKLGKYEEIRATCGIRRRIGEERCAKERKKRIVKRQRAAMTHALSVLFTVPYLQHNLYR